MAPPRRPRRRMQERREERSRWLGVFFKFFFFNVFCGFDVYCKINVKYMATVICSCIFFFTMEDFGNGCVLWQVNHENFEVLPAVSSLLEPVRC